MAGWLLDLALCIQAREGDLPSFGQAALLAFASGLVRNSQSNQSHLVEAVERFAHMAGDSAIAQLERQVGLAKRRLVQKLQNAAFRVIQFRDKRN
jgi:hypothetical protein